MSTDALGRGSSRATGVLSSRFRHYVTEQLVRPEFLSQPALYFPGGLYFLGSDNDLDLYTCPSK